MLKKVTTNQNRKLDAICLVFPSPSKRVSESASIRLADLIQLVEPSVRDIFIISNRDVAQNAAHQGRVHFIGNMKCPDTGSPILSMMLGELNAQLQIVRGLIVLPDDVKLIFWRGRSSTILMPLLLARLKGKKSILLLESRGSELVSKVYKGPLGIGGFILSQIYKVVEKVTCSLSDRLVVNVPGLLKQPWLAKYESKVCSYLMPNRFIRLEFEVSKPLNQRQPIVGYIGRMSQEKGVLNLVEAIPSICNQMSEVEFLFGGDGPLLKQIENELRGLISQNQTKVLGWIPHNELPGYLNQMKLLVLPSYYEGLPTIVLEAMACGTPVLATPVGAVPDIIMDGTTGFIMEDNSPECIAENVLRALSYPKLDKIAKNAHDLVESQYSYEAMVERYKVILHQLRKAP